jgi:hypothetical protein
VGHDRVRAASFEQSWQVFRRNWIARLGVPVLPGVAEIGYHRGDALRAGVLQRPDKEQQAHELVVGRLPGIAAKRMNDEEILPPHLDKRPDLVLAILEAAFLVIGQYQVEMLCDARSIFPRQRTRSARHPATSHTPQKFAAASVANRNRTLIWRNHVVSGCQYLDNHRVRGAALRRLAPTSDRPPPRSPPSRVVGAIGIAPHRTGI